MEYKHKHYKNLKDRLWLGFLLRNDVGEVEEKKWEWEKTNSHPDQIALGHSLLAGKLLLRSTEGCNHTAYTSLNTPHPCLETMLPTRSFAYREQRGLILHPAETIPRPVSTKSLKRILPGLFHSFCRLVWTQPDQRNGDSTNAATVFSARRFSNLQCVRVHSAWAEITLRPHIPPWCLNGTPEIDC
jgi:hypothetical protein